MARPSERAGSLSSAIIDLETAARIPAKSRTTKISILVENVCGKAFADGLPNTSLHALIDLITLPNEMDQGSVGNLIKNLYPSNKVPDAIVVKVVGSLGHGRSKPSMATQGGLLKWLVMVYDVLENQSILSRLYGPLFNLLDTIAIRSQLCHVLSLITRRKHVRPFRIQALMELTRQAGNDPPLVGLMRVYKDYYPDVIVGDSLSSRASVFMHPNQEWRDRLHEIQDANFQKTQDGIPPTQRAFRVTRRTMNGKRGISSPVIPEVHTSNAQESSTTLEEIENVSDFVRRLEKIELPNQLVAVIGDPLLQKYLQLKSTDATLTRIDNWLLAFFEDQLQSPGSPEILPMLAAVREYSRYSKKLPLACLKYLNSMIDSWDGITGRETIMDLLSFTSIAPFEDLWQTLFQPLEEAVLEDASLEARLDLLKFYGDIIQQWTVNLLSQSQRSPADGQTISEVINHANVLALTILQNSLSVSTCSKVLSFYESTSSLFTFPTLRTTVRITTPLAELIYTLYFTHCLSTLSRLCNILALYKRAFEFAMSAKPNNPAALEQLPYPKEYVNHFNGFLMDICNCIWRARAFNTSDVNALGCLMPASVVTILGKYVSDEETSFSLATLFSLSFSPLFSLLAISYVRELEDKDEEIDLRHAGPVTQASLKQLEKDGGLKLSWADYRLGVLRYLENKGAMGVGELMYNTMKHLMTARDNMG